MANKFKVIGLKFNEGITDLAIFSDEVLAKKHSKSTFGNMGFDKLLIKPVPASCKDAVVIPDDIAEDTTLYVHTKVIMDMLDWTRIRSESEFGTLTEFMLPSSNLLQRKNQLGKLTSNGIEEYGEDSSVKSVSLSIVHSSEDILPYSRILKMLQRESENLLLGSVSDVEDVLESESEEQVSEESVEETVVEEKAKSEKDSKEEEEKAKELERLAKEKSDLKAKEEAERLSKEKAEQVKAEQERVAKEQAEKEKAEAEKAKAEKEALEAQEALAEQERIAKEKAEQEAKDKAEQERLAKEQAEKEAKEKAEQERLAKEQAEKEEAERVAKEKAQQESQPEKKEEPVNSVFGNMMLDL